MTYEEALKQTEQTIALSEGTGIFKKNLDYWKKVKEALEKQIPKNHFINECECIIDYDTLYKAINKKCKSLNCYLQNQYRIVLRNSYPSICINRKWFYVHILVCEFVNNKIRKGYVVHHKDKNKLNAMAENLEIMT